MTPRFDIPFGLADIMRAAVAGGGVSTFESAFARAVDQRHAIAFPYGRTALVALLRALGISGRDVLCPAYTCVVVPNAIVFGGNTPVFVDSAADANADLTLAEKAISNRTGALIATSIFGHPVDLDALDALRRRHPDLPVIQDCAHSFLCTWRGRAVHKEGIAAFFGLNISKTVSSVFGGMVSTDDEALARRVREERDRMLKPVGAARSLRRGLYAVAATVAFNPAIFGTTNRLRDAGLLDRLTRYYDEGRIDMPADYLESLSDFEARVGVLSCARLDANIEARRRYDAYYRQALADHPAISWIPRDPAGTSVSHSAARVARRDAVRRAAARRGVELGEVIEYSVPDMASYRPLVPPGMTFAVASQFSTSTINLPTKTRFDETVAARVVARLRDILDAEPAVPPLPAA